VAFHLSQGEQLLRYGKLATSSVKDLFKVGAVLTVVEGLLILVLGPLCWPQIGLSWRTTPPAPVKIVSYISDVPEIWAPAWQHTAAPMQRPCTHTECIKTRRSGDASVNP
jgi:hypothetical protein